MRKLNFDLIFKIFLIVLFSYFLFILTKISNNLEIGRYQFLKETYEVFDTKTGKVYNNDKDILNEKK